MKASICGILCALCATLAGCANQTSIWRNEKADGNIVGMDAQQRVILSSPMVHTEKGGEATSWARYCPEPSPDAIASFAATLAAGLSTGEKQASVQNALATSVASVGLRTPTTQVIRDLITAACIADLNKSFSSEHYRNAFARNQQFVLAAHAIAVLGGDAAAGQAAASSNAAQTGNVEAAGMFDRYQKAQAARQKAESTVASAKADTAAAAAETKKAQEALDAKKKDGSATAENVKALEDALNVRKAVQKQRVADEAAAVTALNDARALESAASKSVAAVSGSASISASGTAVPGTVTLGSRSGLSDRAVDAIQRITLQVINTGFTLDKCLEQLESVSKSSSLTSEVKQDLLTRVTTMCTDSVDARRAFNRLLMLQ